MGNLWPAEEGSLLRKFHLISADKKLTHDLIELAGSLATSDTRLLVIQP